LSHAGDLNLMRSRQQPAKPGLNDTFAGKDGNVYKRGSEGTWQQHGSSGSGLFGGGDRFGGGHRLGGGGFGGFGGRFRR